MAKSNWKAFPYADKSFDYAGDKLAKAWPKLHAGDQEAFPDEKHVARLLKANPQLAKSAAGKDAGSSRSRCRTRGVRFTGATSTQRTRAASH